MAQPKDKTTSEFTKFRALTKRIVSVPKSEIDKRADADKRGPGVPKTKVA